MPAKKMQSLDKTSHLVRRFSKNESCGSNEASVSSIKARVMLGKIEESSVGVATMLSLTIKMQDPVDSDTKPSRSSIIGKVGRFEEIEVGVTSNVARRLFM